MSDFIERPASKLSLSKRKPLKGGAINDADYCTTHRTKGTPMTRCPYYLVWVNMIKRCYSPIIHKHRPHYKDCSVCDEWLLFSTFKQWMERQDWKGKHLDKDILVLGNKVYSPETCRFVSLQVNCIFGDRKVSRGKYPQGVSLDKLREHTTGKCFLSRCSTAGKHKNLGYFYTAREASQAYIKYKADYIRRVADTLPVDLKQGLYRHADALLLP